MPAKPKGRPELSRIRTVSFCDYPFFLPSQPAKGLSDLKLPGEVQRAIERDNAAGLLPRWNT
jgi:hypothetical protein